MSMNPWDPKNRATAIRQNAARKREQQEEKERMEAAPPQGYGLDGYPLQPPKRSDK